ncbi:hypothetical protein MNBD_GAMMA12-953 [hydrothermal vent metagenome]|uniref:Uncharacterized protein n=1 Tax=hydrothermal vent metagenome TaxID=652676 RepID=A0A3B0Z488_9ZZZZ
MSILMWVNSFSIFDSMKNYSIGKKKIVLKALSAFAYYKVERLVMEATGRYEFNLAQAAYTKGGPSLHRKTIIGSTPRKSKNLIAIRDLIARRLQLMNLRTQELNRIKVMGKIFEISCKRIIRCLDTEIERMEKRFAKHVEEQAEWSEKQTILKSAPVLATLLLILFLRSFLNWDRSITKRSLR